MEINDAEDRPLVRFVGNLEEDTVQIDRQNQAHDDRQSENYFQTHGGYPTSTISTKANDKMVKTTLNATRMRNQIMFSASEPPLISTRLSSMAPTNAGISIG